jgi:hypothetical protein
LHFIAKSTLSLYGRKRKNANFGAYKKMPTLLVLWDQLRAWKRKRQETPGNGVPPKNIFFAYLMSAPPQYKGDATFCTGTAYLIKLANKLNQINLLK